MWAADGYKYCSEEYKTCKCIGSVRYGNPSLTGKFATKKSNGTIDCGNAIFGDPAPNVIKACYCKADNPINEVLPTNTLKSITPKDKIKPKKTSESDGMSDNWDDMDMDEEDDTSDTVKPVKPATDSKSISEQLKEKLAADAAKAKKNMEKAAKDLKEKAAKAKKDAKKKADKAKKDLIEKAKRLNPFSHFIQIDDEATSHSNSKTDSIDLPIFAEVKNNKMKKTNLRKVKSLMNQEELHQAYSLLLQKSNLLLSKI